MFNHPLLNTSARILSRALLSAVALGCDAGPAPDVEDQDPREIIENGAELNPDGFEVCTDAELRTVAEQVQCLQDERAAECQAAGEPDDCREGDLYKFNGEVDACPLAGELSDACVEALTPAEEPPANDDAFAPKNCTTHQNLVDIAQAAYFNNPDYSLNGFAELYDTYSNGGTHGHIVLWGLYNPNVPRRCIASIRGSFDSGNANDIVDDIIDGLSSMAQVDCGSLPGECGYGFLTEYQNIRDAGMLSDLKDLVEDGTCGQGVTLVGHSSGGAVADILAAKLYEYDSDLFDTSRLYVETYGEPRVFDHSLADRYQTRIKKTRWMMEADPVPGYPGSSTFKHFGTQREIYWNLWDWSWKFKHQGGQNSGGGSAPWDHLMGTYDDTLDECN